MTGLSSNGGARPLSLERFLVELARAPVSSLGHARLLKLADRLALDEELLARRTLFSDAAYARNLVLRTPEVEVLVLCWRPGQQSTIHDHAGSLNAIRVHRGRLTSRVFVPVTGASPGHGPVELVSAETLGAGTTTGLDRGGIHQLANLSDEDLVTVHLYAPPLLSVTVYSTESPDAVPQPLRYTVADDIA